MSGSAAEQLRVVVIDDHEMVADALALALAQHGISVVAQARTLAEGVPLASGTDADVVLLDFRLPDGDALEALERLREPGSLAPVLVLTAVADHRTAVDVLAAGASGYVTKDLAVVDLVAAIRTVAAGDRVIPPDLAGALVDRLRAPSGGRGAALTPREVDALRLLADGQGIAEIAATLGLTRNTVRKHVQAVLSKLGAHTQLEAVAIARREGLVGR